MGARDWWRRLRGQDQPGGRFAALFEPSPPGEAIALDLEASGLDSARDHILSIAAVPVIGRRVQLGRALQLTIRAPSESALSAIRHHRLRPQDLEAGVSLDEALDALVAMLGSRPVIGYHLAFDFGLLNRELRARNGPRLPNRRLDIQQRYVDWMRRTQPEHVPQQSFDGILAGLGLPALDRHDALGDAVSAALAWIKLEALRG